MDDNDSIKTELSVLRTRLELLEQSTFAANAAIAPAAAQNGFVPIAQIPAAATVTSTTGVFAVDIQSDENDSVTGVRIYDNYFSFGEISTSIPDTDVMGIIRTTPFIALKVTASGSQYGEQGEIVGYSSFAALTAAQRDPEYVIRPLYLFQMTQSEVEGNTVIAVNILIDFRNMPQLQMAEVI